MNKFKQYLNFKYQITFIFLIVTALLSFYQLFQVTNFNIWSSISSISNVLLFNKKPSGNESIIDPYQYIKFDNYGFYPVNDKGVYSFWNVCIESLDTPAIQEYASSFKRIIKYNETKRIVVYNSFYREGQQVLHVSGTPNAMRNDWDILFKKSPIPKTHKFNKGTAFFISPSCPTNFHHFWIDEFVPLFTIIKQANRLKPNSKNALFYRQPMDLNDLITKECTNTTTFEIFLRTLFVEFPHHQVFYEAPHGTCFSSAVFGVNTYYMKNPRNIIEHVVKQLKTKHLKVDEVINEKTCQILILERETRKILNSDKLVNVAESLGYKDVCRVSFNSLPIEEQIQWVRNTKIMVGVQGAGLQWAIFMPPNSNLIEIAWPQKHWGFYFTNYVKPYKIRHHKLIAPHVQPNWTSYEIRVKGGAKVSVADRLRLVNERWTGDSFDNVWKWADVFVDENNFRDVLLTLYD